MASVWEFHGGRVALGRIKYKPVRGSFGEALIMFKRWVGRFQLGRLSITGYEYGKHRKKQENFVFINCKSNDYLNHLDHLQGHQTFIKQLVLDAKIRWLFLRKCQLYSQRNHRGFLRNRRIKYISIHDVPKQSLQYETLRDTHGDIAFLGFVWYAAIIE